MMNHQRHDHPTRSRLSRRQLLLVSAAITVLPLGARAQPPIMRPTSAIDPTAGRIVRLHALDQDGGKTAAQRIVVTAIAADPRGELLAVAGDDHIIRVFEIHSMRVRNVLREHRDLIRTLAFDRTGDRLVSAGNDGQLIVWKRGDDFERRQSMQGTPALSCVRFAPDGEMMAAVGFTSEIYVMGRGESQIPPLECGCNDLRAIAFRDDGRILAVGGRSGELHLYDMHSGKLTGHEELHDGRIRDLAFRPNANDVISVGEDGQVVLFDTATHREKQRIKLASGRCYAVALIDSQRIAVAGSDNVIRVINTDSGQVVQTLNGHEGSVSSLASSGGILFSGGFDATVRRWMLNGPTGGQERIAESDSRTIDTK